jgi:thioredoxin reductase (NADPH)
MERDGYDVVVAGGGLAGLTAGLTAARLGRTALVLTGSIPGGLLLSIDRVDGVPGFPDGVAGYELCPSVQTQADDAGAEVAGVELDALEPADDGWTIATADGRVHARAVVIATGAGFRPLDVPGEERLRGHGVSSCASCDGPLLGGKTAAVVGGGDSALQEALTLAETAARVVILHRGEQLDGQESYRRRVAEQPRIEIRYRVVVEEIVGAESVGALRVRDLASDAVEELEVAAVFPFVGLRPNTERFEEHVELDAHGAVRTNGSLQTDAAGVFAAGVVRSGAAGRAAAAAGEGAAAAVAADGYLAGRV